MILILGKTLVYWTGIVTGIFFLLSFLGCACNLNYKHFSNLKIISFIRRNHRIFMYLAFIFFLLHASLAILTGFGIWI